VAEAERAAIRAEVRAELGAPPEAVVIVQTSRLEAWKGQAVLLAALALLPPASEWRCWIAGGARRPAEVRYLAELRRRAAGLGGRVRFLGERRDVPRLLAAADLFCQPNTAPEPFGVAYVEALAAGLPVVAAALGGALEVVDPTCGLLVPPGRPEALAEALARLAADPAHRRRLGAAGPARARAVADPAAALPRLAGALARALEAA
jgi:glycosyltransferase involved in cell wall biosynthesis